MLPVLPDLKGLFYSHFLNTNRGSFHTVLGIYTSRFLDADSFKNGLEGPESFQGLKSTNEPQESNILPMKVSLIPNVSLGLKRYAINS